jgi:hypothetical protein
MSVHPNINAKVIFGTEAEQKLLPILSSVVGEKLYKTAGTFDCMDMVGSGIFAELKRRTSDWSYCDEKIQREGWLMPSCKVIRGWRELSEGKRVVFFYYWGFDKSLWVYEMKEGDFSSDDCHKIPKGHYDKQLHVTIHQDRWTRCDVDLSGVVFEDEECWITD